jgi:membrane-bound serine protease (ClpP class)
MMHFFILALLGALWAAPSQACTLGITIHEPISASTLDYFQRVEKKALEKNCSSIFVRMNTPGGNLQTTRLIVSHILASPVPYLCLITPAGAHAGSAGALILQACHVNGGVEATNIGAATPISSQGEMPEDLRKKMINDTVSWMEGVTRLRGRDLKFSEEIITEAKSVTSEAAVKAKALDYLVSNEKEFLIKSQGHKTILGEKEEHHVITSDLVEFFPDLRHKVLSFVSDPEFAYLLFMGSLGLLYVEITHPGMIAPGVVGGIGLVLSLITFHKLDVTWGGLALILLGVGFLIAELFLPSFGILGVGGIIAVFVGSLFLFDTVATGHSLPLTLILSVVVTLGAVFLSLGYLALKTLKHKSQDTDSDLKSRIGEVVTVDETALQGQIQIMGETWNFVATSPVIVGDQVQVLDRKGLTLQVQKKNN